MKLLLTAQKYPEDNEMNYSFRLGVKYRSKSGNYDSSGDCGHGKFVDEHSNDAMLGCGVDCDGGGINVTVPADSHLDIDASTSGGSVSIVRLFMAAPTIKPRDGNPWALCPIYSAFRSGSVRPIFATSNLGPLYDTASVIIPASTVRPDAKTR